MFVPSAPLNLPVPEVKALSCSVVLWESGLSDSDSSVSCEDIVGYDVRLYHPESEHRNVTRRVEADRTYYLIDDDDKLANINYETLVQVLLNTELDIIVYLRVMNHPICNPGSSCA